MTKAVIAPAKINLFLDVLGKREDGYHNIKSIMQSVSLYDTVTVSEGDGINIICNNPAVPNDERNIAYRAAVLFYEKTGITGGCEITIDKKIPVAGGLAGGSTDGAATLTALNSIYGEPLNNREILNIGSALGADVPFCIMQGCARCEGIGEIMREIPSELSFDVVIANGGEAVSTPAAYRLLDEESADRLCDSFRSIENAERAIRSGDAGLFIKSAYNAFENVILPRHSVAGRLKKLMYEAGAVFSMMSGSGPSVFGIFENAKKAEDAAEALSLSGFDAHACRTLS